MTPATPLEQPERLAVGFAAALRRQGLAVSTASALAYASALAAVGLTRRHDVYWAGRATLVQRPEDAAVYDQVFAAFWEGSATGRARVVLEPEPVVIALDSEEEPGAEEPEEVEDSGQVLQLHYSPAEVLAGKDFAACTPEELAELARLIAALRVTGPMRPSRRPRPSPSRGRRPDLRRTVRRSLRTGGEPVRRAWLVPGESPRRLVLLLDVSGSMEAYARAMVRFAHAAVSARRRVEVFAVGTRLTRLTRQLAGHDPDAAVAAAAEVVADWSGGTRLGEVLREFNDRWGVPGLARGAVVVILSDGWDRGAPELLGGEMERLRRIARRVIWVNPLKATPGYEPLARGIAAALPHVDEFLDGHCLASLEVLAGAVSR